MPEMCIAIKMNIVQKYTVKEK